MKLINGLQIPKIVFGTWGLENGSATTEAVANAINVGYRAIDSAFSYGNDFFAGKAIKNCGISRNELFVTNKAWKTFYGTESVIEGCKKSLKLMKLDYFDLYLIHWPVSVNEECWESKNIETWMGLERLYKDGLVRAIGTSNFLEHHLKSLKDNGANVLPMINQIEYHVGYTQNGTVEYCKNNGILVEAWSPLGSGTVLADFTVNEIAKKYNKTAAQICLRYVTQSGIVPVVRSSSLTRMKENFESFDFDLEKEDVEILNGIKNVGFSGFHPDKHQPE